MQSNIKAGEADGGAATISNKHNANGKVYSHADKMRVISGILMCILLAALDQTVVLPALPQMAASLHGGAHLSWVVSAYLLTTTATTPIYGKLSDEFGRRAVLVPALAFFGVTCVLCALAQSVPELIGARALQGVGGGALFSVAQAAVADVIPPRERGKYQGYFAGVWAFSSLAGPVAGGFVVQHFSWRWIFWANLPLAVLALALCMRGLAGLPAAGRRGRIDYTGAALLLLAVACLLGGLSTGGVDYAWISRQVAGLFALSCGLFLVLAIQQTRSAEPLFPGPLLARRGYRQILMIAFLNSASMFGAIFLLPLLLQGLLHASAGASGLEMMPFLFSTTVGAYAAGQIARRSGKARNVTAGGLALGVPPFLAMAALPASSPVWAYVALSAWFGAGIGAVMPSTLVMAQSEAGPRDVGAATGILLLLRAMGGAFGATMAGAVLAIYAVPGQPQIQAGGFRLGFLACAFMLAAATWVALRMENVMLRNTLDTAPKLETNH